MPARGASSISRSPAARRPSRTAAMSSTRYATWCRPGPALGEEAADRRVAGERRQQLDVAVADVQQRGLDALLRDRLAVHQRHAVRVAMNGDRGVEVDDRNADVVDAPEHDGECTLSARAHRPRREPGFRRRARPGAAARRDARARRRRRSVRLRRAESRARIAAWEPERIAVAGGDGTIGPVAGLAGRLDVPLAVIPAGTANDFARVHGLPDDLREAAVLAAAGTDTRPLELGRPRRRAPVRERRQRRAGVGCRARRGAAQAAPRRARLRRRRGARGGRRERRCARRCASTAAPPSRESAGR